MDAAEELQAIAAIYSEELVYSEQDAPLPLEFSSGDGKGGGSRDAGQLFAAVVVLRFQCDVTTGCEVHKGVQIVIGEIWNFGWRVAEIQSLCRHAPKPLHQCAPICLVSCTWVSFDIRNRIRVTPVLLH